MCQIDWLATGTMLMGIGACGAVVVGYLTYLKQWGAAKRVAEIEPQLEDTKTQLEDTMRQMRVVSHLNTFLSSEEGTSSRYPADVAVISSTIADKMGISVATVKRDLEVLDAKGLLRMLPLV